MESYRISDALAAIFKMLGRANKYIDETTPWILAKDESKRERLGTVLYNLLETVRFGAVLLTPFMPDTAGKILAQLSSDLSSYETISAFGALRCGVPLGEAFTLFARIDEEKCLAEIEAELAKRNKSEEVIPEPEHEAEIGIDAFAAVELRCAEVLACERVPKAKKLLKLRVSLGYEERQIVSGIAKFYEPEELIGKKVAIVCNLKPAVLCGVESRGMLLASGEDDVRVLFLDPKTKNGDRIH